MAITGTSGNDSLTGTKSGDIIDALAGDDTITTVFGKGARSQTFTVHGDAGSDLLVVDFSNLNNGKTVSTAALVSSVNGGFDGSIVGGTNRITCTGIERLAITGGAGNDSLIGLVGSDTLLGGSGNDLINGGLGTDSLAGGKGNDTFVVDTAADLISEGVAEGTDLVQSSVTLTLGANFENLTLTGTAAINGTGNTLGNLLTGNSARNVLDGGIGTDSLTGGKGDDVYVVDALTDVITEVASEGTDLVQASLTWSLGANLENLTLTGSAAINATGNTLANLLVGNVAGNVLDGGVGSDSLTGGNGSDTYLVDTAADVISEGVGAGTDLVRSAVTLTLGANVENLTLTGTASVNATGNTLGNVLVGNTAGNILDGGAGTDSLAGGTGDDTYAVDAVTDRITELVLGGADLVRASVTWSLGSELENLTLTGTAAIGGTGNTLDNVLTGNTAANVLAGGIGNDTYVVDGAADVTTEAVAEGTDLVVSSITWTLGADVENLTLAGVAAANATGNVLDNLLNGNTADNVLDGGAGIDSLAGGTGDDTYLVDSATDVISEGTAAGSDLVQSSVTLTLGAELEKLTLTGTAAIKATGNTLVNLLTGNTAGNVLDGGAARDSLLGGAGNDTYVVDLSTDVIKEAPLAGTDVVRSSANFTLRDNLEKLTLTGTASISATGNSLVNVLTGNAGANVLNGGAGADSLVGGNGNDTYVVDLSTDVIKEGATGGSDLVRSSTNFTLRDNLEKLTLTGTAVSATGNSLVNVLTGNAAANVLNGGGGADSLVGGKGNDTYLVDVSSDAINEAGSAGIDLVRASASFTLRDNLEKLILTGTAAINGTGNSLVNVLTGNAAANLLNGGGGTDSLVGGKGNDTYVVDVSSDAINEAGSAGTDLVRASANFTLRDNLEQLTLTGTAAINATGNSLVNVLTGNAAANVLNGGAGGDSLVGGKGNDTYLVDSVTDVINEAGSAGTDLVRASVNFTLRDNLEKLTLTGGAAISGTGNSLSNVILGNTGVNKLNGAGSSTGLGQIDSLTGSGGADVFILGTSAGRLYDDGDLAAAGTVDYVQVTDFNAAAGDKLQLKGRAAQYFVGASPVTGVAGQGVFFDSDSSGSKTANDELIAIVHGSSPLNLATQAKFVV